MKFGIPGLSCLLALGAVLSACATPGDDRGKPFSADWHDAQEREDAFDARHDRIYGSKEQREKRKADIVRNRQGDQVLGVRASDSVRADFGYHGGPTGGLKIDWDFAKPERD